MQSLTEYRVGRVSLDDDDLAYLLDLVKATGADDERKLFESISPTRESGRYDVRAGGFVGRIGLPSGDALDISSRFEFSDLIALILGSGRRPLRTDQLEVPAGSDAFVLDALAVAFAREVGRLVSRGLAKGYREHRFDRPPYPGQVDMALHLSRFAARPDRLVTRARRITTDIDVNKALARALEVLERSSVGSAEWELAPLRGAFQRVRRPAMRGSDIARLPLTRLTSRYEAALGLAELIVDGQSIVPRSTGFAGSSIVFNMPKVWEAYVARRITDLWPDHRVEAPFAFDLTADGSLTSEADITVWDGDELIALYDAKYKGLGATPKPGDVYQMVTYCTRLGINEAALVYPGRGEERSFKIAGITVRMWGMEVLSSIGVRFSANGTQRNRPDRRPASR